MERSTVVLTRGTAILAYCVAPRWGWGDFCNGQEAEKDGKSLFHANFFWTKPSFCIENSAAWAGRHLIHVG